MEELKFEKLLFNTATCVMACDGEIHAREIQELKLIAKNTPYFKDLDYQTELDRIMLNIQNNTNIMKQYFEEIKVAELTPVQELLILEIVLRMMYADSRIDENEVKLIRIVKSYLKIPDQIIFDRFGKIEFLIKGYNEIDQQASLNSFPKVEFSEMPNIIGKE